MRRRERTGRLRKQMAWGILGRFDWGRSLLGVYYFNGAPSLAHQALRTALFYTRREARTRLRALIAKLEAAYRALRESEKRSEKEGE